MDTSTTLEEQIQALMDSLADTAYPPPSHAIKVRPEKPTCCMRFTGTMDS